MSGLLLVASPTRQWYRCAVGFFSRSRGDKLVCQDIVVEEFNVYFQTDIGAFYIDRKKVRVFIRKKEIKVT